MNSETTKPGGDRGPQADRPRDEEPAPAFKVIDRRRFAADGTERSESEAEEPKPRPTPPPGGSTASPRPSAAGHVEGAAVHRSPGAVEATRPAEAEPSSAGFGMPVGEAYGDDASHTLEPTFSTLVISLSTQALMLLGEVVEPGQSMPARDLPSAKHLIDMLSVLQQKTTGNLDAAESALLERILFDLRMRFVELSRRA
jgi:hypothetical protein